MHALRTISALAVSLVIVTLPAIARQPQLSDSEYIAQALSAAPKAIAKDAAIVRTEKGGNMRTLRKGTNGFTCLVM
ncbi:MAG TPA: hypothetical protein VKS44_01525, partial [Candidatus Acidoferrales bacterium]|nr:hypothetical protein [Candidatus Acidoferrales bacterium]